MRLSALREPGADDTSAEPSVTDCSRRELPQAGSTLHRQGRHEQLGRHEDAQH